MQLKKLLQASTFALVAAACAIAAPSIAKAADVTGTTTESKVGTLVVDGVNAQLTVKGATGGEVLVGFPKVNAKGVVSVSAWDTYDGTDATVDLSKLNNTKDNYVAITTPTALASDTITIVKIPAVKKVFKAEFNAATAKVSVGEADKGKPTMAELSKTDADATSGKKYEYRTAYSGWTAMQGASATDVVDLKMYQEEGATLFIRKKGVTEATFPTGQGTDTYTFGKNDKLKAYDSTSTLPGKEAKVAIKAKAKGPAVSADYVKGTVKLPKGAEYRLVGASVEAANSTTGKYNEVGTAAKAYTFAELKGAAGSSTATAVGTNKTITVEARVAADTTKKKAASKWSRITIDEPAAIDSTLLTVGAAKTPAKPTTMTPGTDEVKYGGEGVTKTVIKKTSTDTSSLVAFSYVKSGKLAQYQQDNAVLVENKDADHAYEIMLGAKDATEAPKEGKVYKLALGAGKKVTISGATAIDGASVWVRVAGDKKNKVWAGQYTKVGVIDYNYTVPKQETKTP